MSYSMPWVWLYSSTVSSKTAPATSARSDSLCRRKDGTNFTPEIYCPYTVHGTHTLWNDTLDPLPIKTITYCVVIITALMEGHMSAQSTSWSEWTTAEADRETCTLNYPKCHSDTQKTSAVNSATQWLYPRLAALVSIYVTRMYHQILWL